MSATSKYRQRTIYSHQRSKERREPEKQNPVHALNARHLAEDNEMGARHHRETQKLEKDISREVAHEHNHHGREMPQQAFEKRRAGLNERHTKERREKDKRQAREREADIKKNPLP